MGEPSRTSTASSACSRPRAARTRRTSAVLAVAQVHRAGVIAQQAVRLRQHFAEDLVQVVVGIDDRQEVAQAFGDALSTPDLDQPLLGLGAQLGVLDGQRRLLSKGQPEGDLIVGQRRVGLVVQDERAVGLVTRCERQRDQRVIGPRNTSVAVL